MDGSFTAAGDVMTGPSHLSASAMRRLSEIRDLLCARVIDMREAAILLGIRPDVLPQDIPEAWTNYDSLKDDE
jgi:hypothetical protein